MTRPFVMLQILAIAAVLTCQAPLTAQPGQSTAAPRRQESTEDTAGRTQWDGIFTEEQAKRGAGLYSEHCASCHGVNLSGVERAPSLIGYEFGVAWDNASLGELFDLIRTSMPQDNPNSLSRQANADILAFILQRSGVPAGTADLPTDSDVLNMIQFVMTEP